MNKTYIRDVQNFCGWLGGIIKQRQELDDMMIEVLYQMEKEEARLRAERRRKRTTKSYDKWAKLY